MFPLHYIANDRNEVTVSMLNPNNDMKLLPEYETAVTYLVIGERDVIDIGFTDKLNTGYGSGDDDYINSYINNSLSDAYRKYVGEWVADNFRIGDIVLFRDRNDLSRIHIRTKIASRSAKQYNELRTVINNLNSVIDSKDQQIKMLSNRIKTESNKSIFRIMFDRLKGKISRGR